jgi:two-component system copper resistance phosphate regulon response regulator CusR
MRILVVEDDKMIREFLTRALMESGFGVDASGLASEAENLALEGIHDALVVDLKLPDRDGLELIQRLRAQGVSAPVLILSAQRSVDDRVRGLEMGGDDYMTKPFAMAELLARLRALLRRSTPMQQEATRLRVGDLELDLIRREARRDGMEIQLTKQEFALLEYLCRNAGRVVTRAMVLDHVWKMRIDTSTNIVDVHIHRLRGKIDRDGQHPLIQTIRGVGYILTDITSYL